MEGTSRGTDGGECAVHLEYMHETRRDSGVRLRGRRGRSLLRGGGGAVVYVPRSTVRDCISGVCILQYCITSVYHECVLIVSHSTVQYGAILAHMLH